MQIEQKPFPLISKPVYAFINPVWIAVYYDEIYGLVQTETFNNEPHDAQLHCMARRGYTLISLTKVSP